MCKILKDSYPIASKEHTCMLCNCKIKKGQKYYRQTCVYDGSVYDFIEHEECKAISVKLDMFDDCEDGLTEETFETNIDDYISDNYTKEGIEKLGAMSYYDKVRVILEDLNK